MRPLRFGSLFDPSAEKWKWLILLFFWILMEAIAFLKFGIKTSVDTELYIRLSKEMQEGIRPSGSDFFYSGYALVLSLVDWMGGEPVDVVFIPVLASAFATVAIYKLTKHITKNDFSCFIAAFLFIGWLEFHQWNLIVYTDSLFASCAIISITLIYFSSRMVHYCGAGLFLLFTILIRPTGLLLLAAMICYFLFMVMQSKSYSKLFKILLLSLVTLTYILVLNFCLTHFIDSFIDSYSRAEVIYPGIPFLVNPINDIFIPDANHSALVKLFLFVINNPFFFVKISVVKAALFLAHIKPYFSLWHNLAIGIVLYPVYYFMVVGFRFPFSGPLKIGMIAFVLLQIVMVSLTSENWDGRFLLPLLPVVFIFSALGLTLFLSKKNRFRTL